MIDTALLASSAIATLIPFLKKGVEAISGEAGKSLYQWISKKLSGKNKQKDLEELSKNPDNQRLQGKVETTVENIITECPSLIDELSKLIEAAKNEAVLIVNSKNVVSGSIHAGGSVIVGDNNSLSSNEKNEK